VPPPEWEGWHRRHPLPGLRLNLDRQLRFVERELSPYFGEFRPPAAMAAAGAGRVNGFYFRGDAEVLYATIRAVTSRGGCWSLVEASPHW
jgi:hypothetical protein